MKTKELEEKEKKCLNFMKKKDYDSFKYLFNEFQHVYEVTRTEYTSKVRASYLMILLTEDWKEYLYYLQKLDFEDVSSTYISFVMDIEIILGEKNPDLLKKEKGKIKEFDDCLDKIFSNTKDKQNKKYKMEQLTVEELRDENPMETIKECLEFTKKFNKI